MTLRKYNTKHKETKDKQPIRNIQKIKVTQKKRTVTQQADTALQDHPKLKSRKERHLQIAHRYKNKSRKRYKKRKASKQK